MAVESGHWDNRSVIPMERGGYVSERPTYVPQVRREPSSTGLYDVLDLILDKGIVIDVWIRVSLVGIELLTIDLRVVIASVDTYLRYAEGAQRLQLYARSESKKLPDVVSGGMKKVEAQNAGRKLQDMSHKVGQVARGAKNKVESASKRPLRRAG